MLTHTKMENGAAWIIIDDGKVNAMSCEMLQNIGAKLEELRDLGAPVVLMGRPGIFSAGFDMMTIERGAEATRKMVQAGIDLIRAMLTFPHPIIAVCTGHAYPMGALLLLSADVRIGISGDWRIGLNEVAIGITVPQFVIELARHRLVPAAVTRISTGEMFPPDEAAALGYLDHVVEAGELAGLLRHEVERLKKIDVAAYAATKARLNTSTIHAIEAAGVPQLVD